MKSWREKIHKAASDRENGASVIALTAAHAFAQAAEEGAPPEELLDAARTLANGQPLMAPVLRLACDIAGAVLKRDRTRILETAEEWVSALENAENAFRGQLIASSSLRREFPWVFFSWSSTVNSGIAVLAEKTVRNGSALVGESRPGGEGARTAEFIASIGWRVALLPDAVLFDRVARGEAAVVVLGCDALDPHRFINKSGSGSLARLARQAGIPVEIWTSSRKFLSPEFMERLVEQLNKAPANTGQSGPVAREQPIFGLGLMKDISLLRTEEGELTPGEADEHIAAFHEVSPEVLFNDG